MKQNSGVLLYDRIVSGQYPFAVPFNVDDRVTMLNAMQKAQVIRGDNVAEYFFQHGEKKKWSLSEDFPNLAMPFESTWVEFFSPMYKARCGTLVQSHEVETLDEAENFALPQREGYNRFETRANWRAELFADRVANSKRFHLLTLFPIISLPVGGEMHVASGAAFLLVLNDRGALISTRICSQCMADFQDPEAALNDAMGGCAAPALLSICFLHCRNIEMVKRTPEAKFASVWEKRRGVPLSSFHEINISPVRKILEGEGAIERNGLSKALHIVRGHFAHYVPERGFLGRAITEPVTVWKPAHARGSAEIGTAEKRYKMGKRPESETAVPA